MSVLVRIIIISKNILNVETGLYIGFLSPTLFASHTTAIRDLSYTVNLGIFVVKIFS